MGTDEALPTGEPVVDLEVGCDGACQPGDSLRGARGSDGEQEDDAHECVSSSGASLLLRLP